VRSDCAVDDAESVDLHFQGVAVGDHAAVSYFKVPNHLSMTPLVWGDRTVNVSQRRFWSVERDLEHLSAKAGTVVRHHRDGRGRHAEHLPGRPEHLSPEADRYAGIGSAAARSRKRPSPGSCHVSSALGQRFLAVPVIATSLRSGASLAGASGRKV
jgi:hypothetical protein